MTEQNHLGKVGEATLELWAHTRRINPQRVMFDETGWDYVLEFEPEPKVDPSGATLPADRWPPPLRCSIQVKATSQDRPSRPMRLKNLLLLASNPQPAFVLMLRFVDLRLEDAFLFPIDEARVRDTLERVRIAFRDRRDLTSIEVEFTGDLSTKIDPSPAGLEAGIRAHVGASMTEYMAKKLSWIADSGYEGGRGRVSFDIDTTNLAGMSIDEYFVELSLGARGPIPVENVVAREVRFGIESGAPDLVLPSGTLEIDVAPVGTTIVTIRCRDLRANLSMEVITPGGLGEAVDPKALKVRLRGKFLDLVVGHTQMNVTFTQPSASDRIRLRDFQELANFILVTEKSADLNVPVNFSFEINGKRPRVDIFLAIIPRDRNLVNLSRLILEAWGMAKYFDIHDLVELTIEELVSARVAIEQAFYLVGPGTLGDIDFSSSQPIDAQGKVVRVLYTIRLTLGSYEAALVASIEGSLSHRQSPPGGDCLYSFKPSSRKIERTLIGDPDGPPLDFDEIIRETRVSLGDAVWLSIRRQ